MESYPQQCRSADGKTFTQDIGNEMDKMDLIRVNSPRPNSVIGPVINISGEARGTWFFEASFPIVLEDKEGNVLATHYATALADWMTEDFVPFESELEVDFGKAKEGILVLKKDNPSGLPEYEDGIRIPLFFDSKQSEEAATEFNYEHDELLAWEKRIKKRLPKFELSTLKKIMKKQIEVDYSNTIPVGSPMVDFIDNLKTKYESPDGTTLLVVSASGESPDSEVLLINENDEFDRVLFCGTPCIWDGGGWISDTVFFVTGTEEDMASSKMPIPFQPVVHVFDLEEDTTTKYIGDGEIYIY